MSAILKKSGENRIYFHCLDLLRALAAFLVVLSHVRNCFFRDYQPDFNVFAKAFYFISNFGHEAVIIFFVLSGCVVGRIILRGVETGTWSWGDYLFDRFTRLWIVLVPALFLTATFDRLSLALSSPTSFVHTGNSFGYIFNTPLANHLSASIFLGNLFYLQTIFVSTFGSNNPLWSLANEFWYYIAFPLLFVGLMQSGPAWRKFCLLLGGILVLVFAGWQIDVLFPVWLTGMAAFVLFQKRPPSRKWIAAGLGSGVIATVALLTLCRTEILPHLIGTTLSDNFLGFACGWLIYFALAVQPPELVSRVAGFFSKFSYSVYLLHLPLITFIAAVFIGTNENRLMPTPESLLLILASLIVIYLYAYGVSLLTENKTSGFRRWIKSRLKSNVDG